MPDWITGPLKVLVGEASLLQGAFWGIAVGALLYALWRLRKPAARLLGVVDAMARMPEIAESTEARLASLEQSIAEVHHELHPNSGTSMKDALARVEATTERLEDGVAGLYDEVNRLAEVDDWLTEELERTHPTEGGLYRNEEEEPG